MARLTILLLVVLCACANAEWIDLLGLEQTEARSLLETLLEELRVQQHTDIGINRFRWAQVNSEGMANTYQMRFDGQYQKYSYDCNAKIFENREKTDIQELELVCENMTFNVRRQRT